MATLTAGQLNALCTVHDDDTDDVDLWFPNTYVGTISLAEEQALVDRACWNWALCAGQEANEDAATSPKMLYRGTNPEDWDNLDAFNEPTQRVALNAADFAGQYASEPNLNVLWNTAKGAHATVPQKEAFMTAMVRIAARANGLTPTNVATAYSLHVTVPDHEWYHWQHWALGFHYGGQVRYIQTEPQIPINWGFQRVWEANRAGHLTVSTYLTGIHDRHVRVIQVFLSLPRCRTCNRVKPRATTPSSRWHRCPAGHTFCGTCGYRLTRNAFFSETRRCNVHGCNGVTALMADNAR